MELNAEPRVEVAANVFKELCYNYRDSLTAAILVAGWDKIKGGQVYNIMLGGSCHRLPIAIGGSGSTYIFGYVDAHYKPGMTKDQCLELVKNCKSTFKYMSSSCTLKERILFYIILYFLALALAMSRDGGSGGVIRLGVITEKGIERQTIIGNDIPKFYEN